MTIACNRHMSGRDIHSTSIWPQGRMPGYRDWQFVSIAHEEGDKPDIRVLGNNLH
jgi:hypothetical protein